MFSQKGKGQLSRPTALQFGDKYVHVSDLLNHHIAVYETSGQYIASLEMFGMEVFHAPILYHLLCQWVHMCVTTPTIKYKCFKLTLDLYTIIL